jgi:hypothetical protein
MSDVIANSNPSAPDVDAGHSRSGLSGSDARATAEPGRNGRVAGGLDSLSRQPSLISRLAQAESDIVDLVDAWNELPEAYTPGSANRIAFENIERACELISSARADLIGDAR